MKISSENQRSKISKVQITNDVLSGRGGLAFVMRYVDQIGVLDMVEKRFGHLRKSSKGAPIKEAIRQILGHCFDGSSQAISHFDELKTDEGYAAVLERSTDQLLSSASVKRLLGKFRGTAYMGFRSILNNLFVWRLKQEKPRIIVLHLDTMVLDNNSAHKREGVKPTYKSVCGFQPLQINWGPYIIDTHFRSGEKHSNHDNDAKEAVARIVKLIRSEYDKNIPIILSADSGFLSEENLIYFEEKLKCSYVIMGKLYDSVYNTIEENRINESDRIAKQDAAWICYDYESKLNSWERSRRTILTSLVCSDDQYVLQGVRDSVMYTNLGMSKDLDAEITLRGFQEHLTTSGIVKIAHKNGEEELNHRSIKEFMGSEHLPFKNFGMNGAYYSLMVISHFLLESFRYDILADVIPKRCYPTSLRRMVFDIAVKIVRTSRKIVLKTTKTVWEQLRVEDIWLRCNQQLKIS